MTEDVKKVTVEIARPRGSYPGRVEVGYYAVHDQVVTLVEPNGIAVDKYKLTRKLQPNEDAAAVACVLTRRRYSKGGAGDFNRPLQYPKLGLSEFAAGSISPSSFRGGAASQRYAAGRHSLPSVFLQLTVAAPKAGCTPGRGLKTRT
jgi:hypothetical protein